MALSAAALVADYLVFSLISARHHVTQWSVTFLGGESFEGSRFKFQESITAKSSYDQS